VIMRRPFTAGLLVPSPAGALPVGAGRLGRRPGHRRAVAWAARPAESARQAGTCEAGVAGVADGARAFRRNHDRVRYGSVRFVEIVSG
jgi:hypothetical protein